MKRYKILLLLFIIMLFPIKINALTGNINIGCSSNNIKAGDIITCTISGNTDEAIKKIDANITLGSNLQLVGNELSLLDGWTGSLINNSKISVSIEEKTGSFSIGTFQVKALDNAENASSSIKIDSTLFTKSSDSSSVNIVDAIYDITINNDNVQPTGLSSLSIGGGTLSPIFDTQTKQYTVFIDSDVFSINLTLANPNDQIVIVNTDDNSNIDANSISFLPKSGSSSMYIEIKVGTEERLVTYSLMVSRKTSSDDIKYLSSLTIGGKAISLINGKYDYEVTLNDTSNFTVKAVLVESSKYLIENLNGNVETGIYETTTNNTSLAIIIKPKDATAGLEGVTYSVVVKKSDEQNNPGNNNIQNNVSNPQTGNISIFVITLILISSLIISLNMYKKNIENYD